ncbi:MAG TPA: hypothetical protein VMU19_11940, partial [Bryobacteraceae bacterium]|nr:hypothetical protein [Bryobacteraceae bacterium]
QAIAASGDEARAAVEFELVSILRGPSFRGSPRSAAFLRFVVEETLSGRQGLLKERTLGVALLGKAPAYDTGTDSGVRVRANDVRRRLASHYEAVVPKAGIRIELPPGAYTPRFVSLEGGLAPAARSSSAPPPMRFWQLAAPSLLALFLALIAVRGDMDSNDSFSRFWNRALAGRSEIAVVVDGDGPASIPPAMADAAMPLELLAGALQVPVHIVSAEGQAPASNVCVIRMSLRQMPRGPVILRLDGSTVFRGDDGVTLWLWAENAEHLRSAAVTMASRSGFPAPE